ncbi:FMN-binding glutamate synthase family protein [Isoalcanivorax beigongshangi]|uniref:FMN-binding glutamate synthase family protein n=1 Tax=Isoalcanivorax beigongshangi TaxID=3238810 RepID=A0ABV4AHP8_9GAMM
MALSSWARFSVWALCILVAAVSVVALLAGARSAWWVLLALVFSALALRGLADVLQTRHAIRRNYPVVGNIRYIFENFRPELRQYLFESDNDQVPFSRAQRSLIYQRAKNENADRPFGTLLDVYANGYEFVGHSMQPALPADPATFRVTVGGPQCRQPYSLSLFNISAMSFGALSAQAIRALNAGARKGSFAHDTGEGSISPYHLEHGGDLIWEIGSGYFGCRDHYGRFDPERFREQAQRDAVKMIEIKLSQGAKPGHGGILPAHKVSEEIAATRGVPMGQDCVSPARHSAFSTPLELLEFIQQLRELSDGKPVGFKLCLGHPWEFMAIVKAMLKTGIYPDFIVVDGNEGGTGAAPLELANHVGVPMREGLLLVHNTLVGAGLREHIRIGVAGKIVSAFDVAAALAIGADWTNSARGFMFALGCIQSLSCHTNRCPVGVATQDPVRQQALSVPDKAERVYQFHRNTLLALSEMVAAGGIDHPSHLRPHHLACRVSSTEIQLFSKLYPYLEPGALLQGEVDNDFYRRMWPLARAEQFSPAHLTRQ